MKRNHYLILGGIALIGGYLWYKKNKENKAKKSISALATTTAPIKDGEASNASGSTCKCDNGFTGWCQSGDCSKCCGSYNEKKRPIETRTYNFMRQQQQARKQYASNY
jgi:hypothetical protein